MQQKLTTFLRDNADQIIENWLAETALAPVNPATQSIGEISYTAINELFLATVTYLENPCKPISLHESPQSRPEEHFSCDLVLPACSELYRSGQLAMVDAIHELTADAAEFSLEELCQFEQLIQQSLAIVMQQQIHHCKIAEHANFCPFDIDSLGTDFIGNN